MKMQGVSKTKFKSKKKVENIFLIFNNSIIFKIYSGNNIPVV